MGMDKNTLCLFYHIYLNSYLGCQASRHVRELWLHQDFRGMAKVQWDLCLCLWESIGAVCWKKCCNSLCNTNCVSEDHLIMISCNGWTEKQICVIQKIFKNILFFEKIRMDFARILGWVAMPFSRGSSQPRDCTRISCVSYMIGGFFTIGTTWEAPFLQRKHSFLFEINLTLAGRKEAQNTFFFKS